MSVREDHIYCWNCGARLKPGANFCGECGAPVKPHGQINPPLREPVPTPQASVPTPPVWPPPSQTAAPQPMPAQPPQAPVTLFDPRRRYYAIDRSWWGWGSGDIYDETGKVIGHMYRRVLSLRHTIEFREANDVTVSAVIHKKIAAIRDTLDIEDAGEQLLGRVKQKILAVLHPVIWMEDANGRKILEGQGDFLGFSFTINDTLGKTVAQIDKTDKWKDIFAGGSAFDFSQKYAVVVYTDIDRRLIVPLAIAIDEAIHEDRKGRG